MTGTRILLGVVSVGVLATPALTTPARAAQAASFMTNH